jgi:parallel beta-helix repeat protein
MPRAAINIFRNNTFDITSASREIIAVDGSANNQLLTNTIKKPPNGGIYLYRNCGEGGTVRHQSPQNNFIAGNTIDNTGGYGIWLGSRNGGRLYCRDDAGSPLAAARTMVTLLTITPSGTTLSLVVLIQ